MMGSGIHLRFRTEQRTYDVLRELVMVPTEPLPKSLEGVEVAGPTIDIKRQDKYTVVLDRKTIPQQIQSFNTKEEVEAAVYRKERLDLAEKRLQAMSDRRWGL